MLRLLVKNGLKSDFRKFIPYIVTVLVAVLIVSGTATIKQAFFDLAMGPLVRFIGGDTMVIKSEKAPSFNIRHQGAALISKQLFRASDLLPALGDPAAGQELHIALPSCYVKGTTTYVGLFGVQRLSQVDNWNTVAGEVPDFSREVPWDGGPIPVAVYFESRVPVELGDQFALRLPALLPEGGGTPNIIGIAEMVPGIDYLDYKDVRTVTCEVRAIVRESWHNFTYNTVYMPLRTLQDVIGGADYINTLYLLGEKRDLSSVEQRAEDLKAMAPPDFQFTVAPAVLGLKDEMTALESHADRLLQIVFGISALMVVNVLVLILSHRRRQDAQLLFIGLRRWQLLVSVGWQVFLVSLIAVILGLALPMTGGVVAFRTEVLSKVPIGRFLVLIPIATALALLVATVLLPRKTDTLEAMRND